MKTLSLIVAAAALLSLAAGCETLNQASPTDRRQDEQLRNLGDKVQELQERIKTIQQEDQNLGREIEAVQGTARGASTGSLARVELLEEQVQALNKAREQDRAAIVEEISRKVAAMLSADQTGNAGQTATNKAKATEYGYEYVVQPGQTLSHIAKEYKVSVSAILKANNLKDPNSIRAGQKLFIPENK